MNPLLRVFPVFLILLGSNLSGAVSGGAGEWRFDFGVEAEEGFILVDEDSTYTEERGHGWVGRHDVAAGGQTRPDTLLRDFVIGKEPAAFRIDLSSGIYRVAIRFGDMHVGNHSTAVFFSEGGVEFPEVWPSAGEYKTVSAAFWVEEDFLEVRLENRATNWLVNAMTVERVEEPEEVEIERVRHGPPARPAIPTRRAGWPDLEDWDDPVQSHVDRFRERLSEAAAIHPSGLGADDYLKQIAGNVDFFKNHQDERGAIIDPYEEEEMQYATPAFALSAVTLVRFADREDLLEAAALAMDWATYSLQRGEAPQQHEHFFPHMLAHALAHFEAAGVSGERTATWRARLGDFDAREVYRGVGGGNWNVVAMSGQAMLYLMGVREDLDFVEDSLAIQGSYFSDWGLYVDGTHEAMAYDHFPRLWLNDLLAHGWDGAHAEELRETLWRGAYTSLFIQSPAGELPTGMRSAQHQWNEAQQCATFEIFARKSAARGDREMAEAFKRAARLSLGSIRRWTRPSGELWIVKNRVDPEERHGYEGYSFHSQYNLLAMGMLAIAYEHGRHNTDLKEGPAPADVGGFVIDLREFFHKIVANAGGHHILIDTEGDENFNPTGLLRVHHRKGNPQLGPSDGLAAARHGVSAAAGVSWQGAHGEWRSLAGYHWGEIDEAELAVSNEETGDVAFDVRYLADFEGIDEVVEQYRITPDVVSLEARVTGYDGPMRMVVPLLASDGDRGTTIESGEDFARVRLGLDVQRFSFPGAAEVGIEEETRAFRNGWVRLGLARFEPGASPVLQIRAETP